MSQPLQKPPPTPAEIEAHRKWCARIRPKHKIKRWHPPYCSCTCGDWEKSCPGGLSIVKQRDYLLDGFLEHVKDVTAERRRWLKERKAKKATSA